MQRNDIGEVSRRSANAPRLAACVLALVIALPGAAVAQEEPQEPMEASETEAMPEAMPEPAPVDDGGQFLSDMPAAGQLAGVAPDTYTIQTGDTLWDICARMLGDPFFWPKLWTFNQYITNPHWIYPGNLLSFREGTETAPPQFEVTKPDAPVAMAPVEPTIPFEDPGMTPVEPAPIAAVPVDELQEGFSTPMEAAPAVAAAPQQMSFAPAAAARPDSRFNLRQEGFIAEQQIPPIGNVYKSEKPVQNLSENDELYLRLQDASQARVGKRLTVFRTLKRVKHPKTRRYIGFLTKILADVEITAVNDGVATARIVTSYDAVRRGDPLTEHVDVVRSFELAPNSANLDGVIVASMAENLTIMGNGNVLYIDKGESDGVRQGNTIDVVRSGDGLVKGAFQERDASLPEEVVGRLVVVGVRQNTATAVVVDAFDALRIGDRVRMVGN